MSFKYFVYQEAKGNECDYPRLEEFRTRKEADQYIRTCKAEDRETGRPPRPWHIEKIQTRDPYLVTYEHAHGSRRPTSHEKVVQAYNAKEACEIVLEHYYEAMNALYARRGTCADAAAHGVRYPYHRHATRLPG
jgi:hypothetical protein